MISVSEARNIIQQNIQLLAAVKLPLSKCDGLILAEDVFASVDIPAFPQSSMDGYAFSFNSWNANEGLLIEREVAAGSSQSSPLDPKKVARIFTGAPVPPGADTVVMQERTRTENGKLIIEDEKLKMGINVRPQGSEIKADTLALQKETRLSSAAIGFLAGIGTTELTVYPNPTITIIVTGNELQQPGAPLTYGQVYDSNSFTLTAALRSLNIDDVKIERVKDDPSALIETLNRALSRSDVVLLTGGVSAGDYDFVLPAASECGVTQLFHKVKQRPGKPLFFGKKDKKLIFGLPGNPSSVLTCFYLYVLPALELLTKRNLSLRAIDAMIGKSYRKDAGLTHFLKGKFNNDVAIPLDAQESYRMRSYALANCLIQLDEEITDCLEGSTVRIHLLPT
jgi:molybdopterin molybdotransferase